ncbi:hypothetical protein B0H11DRAFT_2237689 [Mycena galericulata]|nr:hypothetical protein B0H11DRAFT_2237689 [Mycena galericulata]
MGIEHFQLSKAGAAFRHASQKQNTKRAAATSDPSCATGAFYTSPTLGASYDALSPLTLSWNPSLSCLLPAPSLLDVYLYAPGAATPRLHMYTGVPYAPGTYSASILPRWWNATSSVSLQVMLVPSGTPPFLSPLPAGPVFTATYTAPANGSTPAAADTALNTANQGTTTVTPTSVAGVSSHPLSPGKKAAAALLPLLFVILLGFLYLKHTRARGQKKRSAWSEKLDKRMSSISADWRAITPGGAKEAVRHSIAHSRASVYETGAIRTGAVEGEPVVMGEKPRASGSGGSIEINAADLPRTTLGSGVGVGVGARRPRTTTTTTPPDRNSRAVSFADAAHPRPSLSNSVYSRTSRAFHTASTYNDFVGGEGEAPPVPALPSPSRVSAYGAGAGAGAGADRVSSAYSGGAERGHSVYTTHGAWSSGERVEGVDGGYGARSVSPTGRVHTINYPSAYSPSGNAEDGEYYAYEGTSPAPTYTTHVAASGSYFSPTTPTPQGGFEVYEPSADSAYNATTFGAFGGSPAESASGSENGGGVQSGITSPRQTAGPLTLTPEDIRRRMTMQRPGPGAQGAQGGQQQGEWRQSVDEVFGALSCEFFVLFGFWVWMCRAVLLFVLVFLPVIRRPSSVSFLPCVGYYPASPPRLPRLFASPHRSLLPCSCLTSHSTTPRTPSALLPCFFRSSLTLSFAPHSITRTRFLPALLPPPLSLSFSFLAFIFIFILLTPRSSLFPWSGPPSSSSFLRLYPRLPLSFHSSLTHTPLLPFLSLPSFSSPVPAIVFWSRPPSSSSFLRLYPRLPPFSLNRLPFLSTSRPALRLLLHSPFFVAYPFPHLPPLPCVISPRLFSFPPSFLLLLASSPSCRRSLVALPCRPPSFLSLPSPSLLPPLFPS